MGPASPRGFYFLSRPVLSSPPSVRPRPPLLPPPPPSFLFPSISPSPPVPASLTHTHTPHSLQRSHLLLQRPPRLLSSYCRRARRSFLAWLGEPRGWWRRGFVLEPRRVLAARRSGTREGAALEPGSVQRDHLVWPGLRGPCREQKPGFVTRGGDLALAAVKPAVRSLAERRPPPTAMAGSDEVNRNECKVRARLPSLPSFLGLPCTSTSFVARGMCPAVLASVRLPASVARFGGRVRQGRGSRFVPPAALYDSVGWWWWIGASAGR